MARFVTLLHWDYYRWVLIVKSTGNWYNRTMKLPLRLQSVLWSSDIQKIDSKKDAYYIIHQIFAHGLMSDIRWVMKKYPPGVITGVFKDAFKDYTRARFNFVKNFVLGLNNWQADERLYVKNTPRIIG